MKALLNKNARLSLTVLLSFLAVLISCEQEQYGPNLSVAPGGGTVSTYKSYTLSSTDAQNIYGRVVFWKDNTGLTLVQMGLYNTLSTESYESGIFSGTVALGASTQLVPLYSVDGATGSFKTSKFFIINDKTFFDKLEDYNANVKIMMGTTTVASGDIGSNSDPVAEEG
jgi:hypothetical protein